MQKYCIGTVSPRFHPNWYNNIPTLIVSYAYLRVSLSHFLANRHFAHRILLNFCANIDFRTSFIHYLVLFQHFFSLHNLSFIFYVSITSASACTFE